MGLQRSWTPRNRLKVATGIITRRRTFTAPDGQTVAVTFGKSYRTALGGTTLTRAHITIDGSEYSGIHSPGKPTIFRLMK